MTDVPLHIVLYQPEIPENTGNIGRTCVAVGAKLWLVRPLGFRLDDRRLRRAGLDYWEHLQWEAVDDWHALRRRLSDRGYWFFSKTASQSYTEAGYRARRRVGLRQRIAGIASQPVGGESGSLSSHSHGGGSAQLEPRRERRRGGVRSAAVMINCCANASREKPGQSSSAMPASTTCGRSRTIDIYAS